MKKHLLLLAAACFLLSGQAFSQNWMEIGNYVPLSTFNEIVEFDGNFYAIGHIWNGESGINALHTPTVWKLVENTWTEVGAGFNEAYYVSVEAIAVYGSELYIGGDFSIDNGTDPAFNYVAKWDGTNERWVPVGDGTGSGGGVYELTVFDSKLYAGGDFGELGAATTGNIAAWDGTSWAALGTGLSTGTSGSDAPDQVASMIVYDSKLYVGGKFNDAGGELVHNIATWDGTTWAYLVGNAVNGGGGVDGTSSVNVDIMVMAIFDGDLYIGGTFNRYYDVDYISSPTTVNHLVVWDGSSFTAPVSAIPTNTRVNAMTVFNDRIYVGNYFDDEIYSWDASLFDWRTEPSLGTYYKVTSFYSNATDIYFAFNSGIYMYADPLPKFTASNTTPCPGEELTFTDQSEGSSTVTAWNWTFEGGTPATSTDQNPVVSYTDKGTYDISLEITSADGTKQRVSSDYITVDDTIAILTHPVDRAACSGQQTSFSASATLYQGTYQWQVDPGSGFTDLEDGGDNNVSGATTTNLIYYPKADEDGYKFRMIIFQCENSDTTDEAALTVSASPEIVEQAENVALCVAGDTAIEVMVTGSGTISYQWQYRIANTANYTDLADAGVYSGTTTNKLTVSGADNTLAELYDSDNSDGSVYALYHLIASANGCDAVSSLVYLSIHDIPTVTDEPDDVTMCDQGSGIYTSFQAVPSLTATGFIYQWQVDEGSGFMDMEDDTVFTGTNSSTLTVTQASSMYSGNQYRLMLGSCSPAIYSSAATLTIDDRPADTLLMSTSVKICEGSDASISVAASPGDNTTYQWKDQYETDILADATYSGTTSSTLYISDAGTDLSLSRYLCEMTNGSCTRNSSQFTLTVYSPPTFSGTSDDKTACDSGDAVTFIMGVSGYIGSVNSYQWQEDFAGTGLYSDITDTTMYSGFDAKNLTVKMPVYALNGQKYRLTISGCETDIVSDSVSLIVKATPLIITSPQSTTACLNDPVTFSVKAVGSDLKYRWYRDEGQGTGFTYFTQTTDTFYTISSVQSTQDGWKYKCTVDNGSPCYAIAESQEATLSVASYSLGTQEVNGGSVSFTGNTINAAVDSFYWSFGDGESLSGEINPVHVYQNNVTYNACLWIYDECGGFDKECVSVSVTAVGINEYDQLARLRIYPNPVKDQLMIENTLLNDRIEIFDLGGRKISEMKARSDKSTIDVSGLSGGIYILKLTGKQATREFRFEKL